MLTLSSVLPGSALLLAVVVVLLLGPQPLRRAADEEMLMRYHPLVQRFGYLALAAAVGTGVLGAFFSKTDATREPAFWGMLAFFGLVGAGLVAEGRGRTVLVTEAGITAGQWGRRTLHLPWDHVARVQFTRLGDGYLTLRGARGEQLDINSWLGGYDLLLGYLPQVLPAPVWFEGVRRAIGARRPHLVLPLPSVTFAVPSVLAAVAEDDAPSRIQLQDDFCILDEEVFFIRGYLELPIHDYPHPLALAVWVRQPEPTFWHYFHHHQEAGYADRLGPGMGVLANEVLTGGPSALGHKLDAVYRDAGHRPEIILAPTEHPLAVAQRDGLSLDEAWELLRQNMG